MTDFGESNGRWTFHWLSVGRKQWQSDGHVEAKPMANMEGKNGCDPASAKMNIGWFEPVDNTLFDLE